MLFRTLAPICFTVLFSNRSFEHTYIHFRALFFSKRPAVNRRDGDVCVCVYIYIQDDDDDDGGGDDRARTKNVFSEL